MKRKACGILFRLMLLISVLFCAGCGKEAENKSQADDSSTAEQMEEQEAEELTFPVMLDSDRLELGSFFQYSGINPDCEDVYAEDIGAIQLKNVSGEYLEKAEICVVLCDGQELKFLVEDLPADMEAMVFEVQNMTYDDTVEVFDIQAETSYLSEDSKEEFSYSVNGSEITVENISGEDKNNITLYYHCVIDDMTFGGKSYKLTIDTLQAGKSGIVSDTLCYMGDVMVVNVRDL